MDSGSRNGSILSELLLGPGHLQGQLAWQESRDGAAQRCRPARPFQDFKSNQRMFK